jgi:hypothetical protein
LSANQSLASRPRRLLKDVSERSVRERAEEVALNGRERCRARAKLKARGYGETGATVKRPNDAHGDKLILAPRDASRTIRTA